MTIRTAIPTTTGTTNRTRNSTPAIVRKFLRLAEIDRTTMANPLRWSKTSFCFPAKRARALPEAPMNRAKNFLASPLALAAIPVRVFSGHSAAAAAIAAGVAVALIVVETAEQIAVVAAETAAAVDASNVVPEAVVSTAAAAGVLDMGTPVTDIRVVLN
jgi:hypothetical protein